MWRIEGRAKPRNERAERHNRRFPHNDHGEFGSSHTGSDHERVRPWIADGKSGAHLRTRR
jgi:hypothetical protein